MENEIKKYLIENNQIRVFILSGKQIYKNTDNLEIDAQEKSLLRKALNITALENALNSKNKHVSYIFSSKNRKSEICTQSFSDNTITGKIRLDKEETNFNGGTLQTIYVPNNEYDTSRTSFLPLKHEILYKNMENFYKESEQISTYLIPLSENENNVVLLMQPLPGTDKKLIDNVLNNINSIKTNLTGLDIEEIEKTLASKLNDWAYLESININYCCKCSKEAFLEILSSMHEDLESIIKEKGKIEVSCSMCGKKYIFNEEDFSKNIKK